MTNELAHAGRGQPYPILVHLQFGWDAIAHVSYSRKIVTLFSSVHASMPEKLSSRPMPLVFIPPQGKFGVGGEAPLIRIDPARSCAATR